MNTKSNASSADKAADSTSFAVCPFSFSCVCSRVAMHAADVRHAAFRGLCAHIGTGLDAMYGQVGCRARSML